MGVKFLEQGQRMAGSGPAAVQRASTLPGPGSSLYLIEAAVRQTGILLVLRTHVRGCETVALAIHVLPKAQWCHLRVQETSQEKVVPVMTTWSAKLGHSEWHVSWAFWATGPDPLLVKSTSCRNVRV